MQSAVWENPTAWVGLEATRARIDLNLNERKDDDVSLFLPPSCLPPVIFSWSRFSAARDPGLHQVNKRREYCGLICRWHKSFYEQLLPVKEKMLKWV